MFAGNNPSLAPVAKLAALWCGLVHNSVQWPIHGQYQCRKCGRNYPVTWAGPEPSTTILPSHPQRGYESSRAVIG